MSMLRIDSAYRDFYEVVDTPHHVDPCNHARDDYLFSFTIYDVFDVKTVNSDDYVSGDNPFHDINVDVYAFDGKHSALSGKQFCLRLSAEPDDYLSLIGIESLFRQAMRDSFERQFDSVYYHAWLLISQAGKISWTRL